MVFQICRNLKILRIRFFIFVEIYKSQKIILLRFVETGKSQKIRFLCFVAFDKSKKNVFEVFIKIDKLINYDFSDLLKSTNLKIMNYEICQNLYISKVGCLKFVESDKYQKVICIYWETIVFRSFIFVMVGGRHELEACDFRLPWPPTYC